MISKNFNPCEFYLRRQGKYENDFPLIKFPPKSTKTSFIIGRIETADIQLNIKIISRHHCKIDFVDGRMFIENLQSSNGTWLNEEKIVQRTELEEGDLVGFGCNPLLLPEVDKAENLIFKVLVPDQVELLDSDDEKENVETEKQVNEICAGKLVEEEPEVIELSSDEETDADKNWREKLSQGKTSSPPPEPVKKVAATEKPTNQSLLVSPEESEEEFVSAESSPPRPDDEVEPKTLIKNCWVYLEKLPELIVQEVLRRSNSEPKETVEVEKEKKKTPVKPIATRTLPSVKETKKKVEKIRKNLGKIVDPESDEEKIPAAKKKIVKKKLDDKNNNKLPEVVKDDLECVPTGPVNITIRRKSVSEAFEKNKKVEEQPVSKKAKIAPKETSKPSTSDKKRRLSRSKSPTEERPAKKTLLSRRQSKSSSPSRGKSPVPLTLKLKIPSTSFNSKSSASSSNKSPVSPYSFDDSPEEPENWLKPSKTQNLHSFAKEFPKTFGPPVVIDAPVMPKRRPSVCDPEKKKKIPEKVPERKKSVETPAEPKKTQKTPVDEKLQALFNKYPKTPEIIEAPKMPKRRYSVCEPEKKKKPERKKSIDGKSFELEVDMFTKAANLRNGAAPPRRISVDRRDDEQLKKERKEKLQELSEENKKKKAAEAAALVLTEKRVASKPKVKLTTATRGEKLCNELSTNPKPVVKKQTSGPSRRPSVSISPEPEEDNSAAKLERLKQDFCKPAELVPLKEFGVCNIMQFYATACSTAASLPSRRPTVELEVDDIPPEPSEDPAELLDIPLPGPGFYQQISEPAKEAEETVDAATLEDFPETTLISQQIITVVHKVPVTNLKGILKFPAVGTPTVKKTLNFKPDESLVEVKEFVSVYEKSDFAPEPKEAPVRSNETSVLIRNKIKEQNQLNESRSREVRDALEEDNAAQPVYKNFEEFAIASVLKWSTEWLSLGNDKKPDSFTLSPMKSRYESFEEYKKTLKPLIEMEVLANMISGKAKAKDVWGDLTKISTKKEGSMIKMELSAHSSLKGFKAGTLVIMKIKNSKTGQLDEAFGYVNMASQDHSRSEQSIFISSLHDYELLNEALVIKAQPICYIRADLKPLIALMKLGKSPLLTQILNPLSSTCKIQNLPINSSDSHSQVVEQIVLEMASTNASLIAVEGGPGTGKTRLIVSSIMKMIENAKMIRKALPSILVCAMSNSCVDEIVEALQKPAEKANVKILRTGVVEKSNENVFGLSLKKRADELSRQMKIRYNVAVSTVIKDSNVILTTVNSSHDLMKDKHDFDVCFIDEASQLTEGEFLIPMQLGFKKLVLVGDQRQLQPNISSRMLRSMGFNKSFFERFTEAFSSDTNKPVLKLTEQFRMHPNIFSFPNTKFYSNSISTSLSILNRTPEYKFQPYKLFDIQSEQALTQDTSSYNMHEVDFVIQLADFLAENIHPSLTIGIITPYSRQNSEISKKMKLSNRAQIFTIDSAQGLEKDVVILSLTRSSGLGFLENPQRINVALTRAKRAMYVCGNFSSLQYNELMCNLYLDARARKCYEKVEGVKLSRQELESSLKISP